ncbi:hypothetical protein K9L97_05770 [Candidatus Woesearchaeota archaeon]|nr:hypothetical protein [Candidatus Woesearchaeota archaeon]
MSGKAIFFFGPSGTGKSKIITEQKIKLKNVNLQSIKALTRPKRKYEIDSRDIKGTEETHGYFLDNAEFMNLLNKGKIICPYKYPKGTENYYGLMHYELINKLEENKIIIEQIVPPEVLKILKKEMPTKNYETILVLSDIYEIQKRIILSERNNKLERKKRIKTDITEYLKDHYEFDEIIINETEKIYSKLIAHGILNEQIKRVKNKEEINTEYDTTTSTISKLIKRQKEEKIEIEEIVDSLIKIKYEPIGNGTYLRKSYPLIVPEKYAYIDSDISVVDEAIRPLILTQFLLEDLKLKEENDLLISNIKNQVINKKRQKSDFFSKLIKEKIYDDLESQINDATNKDLKEYLSNKINNVQLNMLIDRFNILENDINYRPILNTIRLNEDDLTKIIVGQEQLNKLNLINLLVLNSENKFIEEYEKNKKIKTNHMIHLFNLTFSINYSKYDVPENIMLKLDIEKMLEESNKLYKNEYNYNNKIDKLNYNTTTDKTLTEFELFKKINSFLSFKAAYSFDEYIYNGEFTIAFLTNIYSKTDYLIKNLELLPHDKNFSGHILKYMCSESERIFDELKKPLMLPYSSFPNIKKTEDLFTNYWINELDNYKISLKKSRESIINLAHKFENEKELDDQQKENIRDLREKVENNENSKLLEIALSIPK